jgi:hypothetical protein
MDGQTQISSPPFPNDTSLASRSTQYTPLRPDHAGSQDTPGNDGYDSNRSPTGSATLHDLGNAKRRKVNHGKTAIFLVSDAKL